MSTVFDEPKPRANYAAELAVSPGDDEGTMDEEGIDEQSTYSQWTLPQPGMYVPASTTSERLPPGLYNVLHSDSIGTYFNRILVLTRGLLRFPHTPLDGVVQEIQKFWARESIFRDYDLTYRRGILMYGPPGGGKTCAIQLIMEDVIARGGIVVNFGNPAIFNDGVHKFREIQPDTPLVVLMEDIDAIIRNYNESDVLNILDGVNQIEKVVYIATTNYPEQLGARVINRPSRFDKRFLIGHPDESSRRMYLEYIIGTDKIQSLSIDLDRWVADTEGFSLAHLKELFTAVVLLGDDYAEAIATLREMLEEQPDSADDNPRKPMGFATARWVSYEQKPSNGRKG